MQDEQFLTVPWVGQQCVIVVFPDHTYVFSDRKHRYVIILETD